MDHEQVMCDETIWEGGSRSISSGGYEEVSEGHYYHSSTRTAWFVSLPSSVVGEMRLKIWRRDGL
jgi:hypothetical protein